MMCCEKIRFALETGFGNLVENGLMLSANKLQ